MMIAQRAVSRFPFPERVVLISVVAESKRRDVNIRKSAGDSVQN